MTTIKSRLIKFAAEDVWAAAVTAQRINSRYVPVSGARDVEGFRPNRDIIVDLLHDAPEKVTQEDKEKGEEVRKYFQAKSFNLLSGRHLSDFDINMIKVTQVDIVDNFLQLGMIASSVSSYQRGKEQDQARTRINFCDAAYLAPIGEKVQVTGEVVTCILSHKWQTYYITFVTTDNKAVLFAHKKPLQVGSNLTIKGFVKAHNMPDGRYVQQKVTHLNRVKVLEGV